MDIEEIAFVITKETCLINCGISNKLTHKLRAFSHIWYCNLGFLKSKKCKLLY